MINQFNKNPNMLLNMQNILSKINRIGNFPSVIIQHIGSFLPLSVMLMEAVRKRDYKKIKIIILYGNQSLWSSKIKEFNMLTPIMSLFYELDVYSFDHDREYLKMTLMTLICGELPLNFNLVKRLIENQILSLEHFEGDILHISLVRMSQCNDKYRFIKNIIKMIPSEILRKSRSSYNGTLLESILKSSASDNRRNYLRDQMIKVGINPAHICDFHHNLLPLAIIRCDTKTVEYCLQNRMDLNDHSYINVNSYGDIALSLLLKYNINCKEVNLLRNINKLISLLYEHDYDFTKANEHGICPLDLMYCFEYFDVLANMPRYFRYKSRFRKEVLKSKYTKNDLELELESEHLNKLKDSRDVDYQNFYDLMLELEAFRYSKNEKIINMCIAKINYAFMDYYSKINIEDEDEDDIDIVVDCELTNILWEIDNMYGFLDIPNIRTKKCKLKK